MAATSKGPLRNFVKIPRGRRNRRGPSIARCQRGKKPERTQTRVRSSGGFGVQNFVVFDSQNTAKPCHSEARAGLTRSRPGAASVETSDRKAGLSPIAKGRSSCRGHRGAASFTQAAGFLNGSGRAQKRWTGPGFTRKLRKPRGSCWEKLGNSQPRLITIRTSFPSSHESLTEAEPVELAKGMASASQP